MDIKDFFKLDFPYKLMLVLVLIQMPFWYVALYLFHKDFYHNQSLYLHLAVCLCFSIALASASLISSTGIMTISKSRSDDSKELIAIWVVTFLIIKLCVFMVLAYCFNWSLIKLIKWFTSIQLFLSFMGGVFLINRRKKS